MAWGFKSLRPYQSFAGLVKCRHAGLKSQCLWRAGSIPATGTKVKARGQDGNATAC